MRLLTTITLLFLVLGQGSALASEMLLADDPPQSSYPGYGFLFLVLSGASAAYSGSAAAESEDKLAEAKAAAAGASGDTAAQDRANSLLQEAKSSEMRANAAVYASVIFLFSSYFSFFPGHLPDNTVFTSEGIAYQVKF